ncbi:uncharacterized protein LOC129594918 isoform X2 [Paramacrobiotus metropolitanus]|uniref:uncharacterized protein LOC129594918 isoform X2 n=2 Tax=Paramacrobiotus metropolitanus TaxID=2943436 RepID=UPI0024463ED4|nr:uncharacterized protein LOC129594918 isoform X2 [Paramacrobiotus metropolitanus]
METSHNLLPVVPNETAPSTDIPKLLKVLNPANVSSIAASMILLSSLDSTKYHLKITVARIGNKAITEPHLAAACADLCAKLSEHMKTKESPGRALRFNTAVVRWAKEYWQDVDRELYALEGRKRENGGSAASWVRIKLESVRQRYLACSRFIAHLFVNGYFTDRSIDVTYFLKKVLPVTMEDVSEGRIECLCAMLPICGPYIRDQKTVDFILNQLKKMIDAQVTSSRIRGIMEEIVNNNCLQRQTATITGGHAVHQEEGRAVETDRPLVLPGCQPLPPDGGAAVESGALMPDTDVTHPSSASETLSTSVDGQAPDYGGCPIVQPVEPGGKRKVLGLLANSLHSQTNMLWPQGGTKRPFATPDAEWACKVAPVHPGLDFAG